MISVTNKMQQNYVFIDSFKSTLHVSGNSFAHLQDYFDCIYSILEQCTDSAADRCIVPKSCICSQSAPEDGRNSPETCTTDLKESIKT